MKKIITVTLLSLLCISGIYAAGRPFVVLREGKKQQIQSITADANGTVKYVIRGGITVKKKVGQYIYARAPMPNNVKEAAKKYRARSYKDAAAAFNEAFKTARYLGWGSYCMYYAAKSQESRDKPAEAIAMLAQLKEMPVDPEEVPYFLKAKKMEAAFLIKEKKMDDALKVLGVITKASDTETAMFANNAKGDILLAQKKDKEALYMYLRNLILFNPDKSSGEFMKAIDKAVEILKARNDPRAAEYEKLKQ